MYRQPLTNIWKKKVTVIKSSVEIKRLKNQENYVDLPLMLQAREKRVQRQEEMLRSCSCLVCFTMNIAGPYKISDCIMRAFAEGVAKIYRLLEQNGIETIKAEQIVEKTGVEGYISLNEDPLKIKRLMVQIEDNFELGRLFDIDVIKPDGEKVSRADIGMDGRNCMICGSEGSGCARSRKHSVEDLQQHFISRICNYFNNQYADWLAQQAVKALLYEVSVTPKPGLVDRADNGSHSDMDFYTFINSSTALYDYFKKCALKAIDLCDKTPQTLFSNLRYLGLEAENKMYQHTLGINTHKGAIFSFGLIVAATAYLSESGQNATAENILDVCAQMAQLSMADFEDQNIHKSFGKQLFKTHNIKGIRGQAAAGYPAVRGAYPLLCQLMRDGASVDEAGVKVLLKLLCEVQDTNIIKRSDEQTLIKVQSRAREIADGDNVSEHLRQMNDEFVKLNISPGGCADLLAICFLLYFIGE